MNRTLRIIFMGTPDFAVESLKSIIENNYEVVGVITAPDRPAGRGRKLQESAVKQYAISKGLRVLQPEKLKNLEIETFKQDLFTCAAKVEEVIAVNVTEQFINENLETIDLSDKLKLQLKEDAMTNGLGRCLHVQKRQVDILKRNGKFSVFNSFSSISKYRSLLIYLSN